MERISVWKSVREFFPGGATLKPSEYDRLAPYLEGDTNVGDIVPAGTPISVETPGGTPAFNSDKCIGLTYEDVQLGTDGCTFTIVTMGEFLESRYGGKTAISETAKTRLFGRISFIKEV